MKAVLAAVNAKYIHSNLAVYCLGAYARMRGEQAEFKEYTINQNPEEILKDLYLAKPDFLALSCYIWNIPWCGKSLPSFISCFRKCPFGWEDRRYPMMLSIF